jgi:single-strand DNA-binding protein
MANYNKIILVGNLTRDPQLSYLPSQTPVVEFGLAVNRKWKDQSGQQREDVCFIDCRAYAKSAEILNQYMSKGRQILIEGRLQFDQWTDKDGNKRSKHRVFIESFQFLDSGQGQGRAPQQGSQGYAPQQGGQGQAPQQAPQQARQMRSPQAPQQAPQGMDEPPAPGPQGPAGEEPQVPAYEEDFAGGQDNIPF